MMRVKAALAVLSTALVVGWVGVAVPADAAAATLAAALPNDVVPAPVSGTGNGTTFTLSPTATVSTDVADIGTYLAGVLRTSTGYAIPITSGSGTITLSLSGAPASVGAQGYQL